MPQSAYTYIIYPENPIADNPSLIDTPILAQNIRTGQIDFQGDDAASVFRQTFAERHSILVKAGSYLITSPLDLRSQMMLTFEAGTILWVPNGYNQYVLGISDAKQYIQISGGRIQEQGRVNSQRQWQGIRIHESTGSELPGPKITYNVIEGIEIWDADVALQLLITNREGWINGNVFRDIVMFSSNVFIDFDMSEEIQNTGGNGFNRNLFVNVIGQRGANTVAGVRNIRHRANVFIDVKIWDLDSNESVSSATIHPDASDTMIFGGIMTNVNFEDQGQETQIIDPWGNKQLYLNRLYIDGGDLVVFPSNAATKNNVNAATLHFDGNRGNLWLGGNGADGDLIIFPSEASDNHNTNAATLHFDGNGGNLWIGGNSADGDLIIFPSGASDNHNTNAATLHFDGNGGNLWIGGNGADGDLIIFPSGASDNHNTNAATLHFDGNGGNLWIGGNGADGDLIIFPSGASDNHNTNAATLHFDGNGGNLWIGGNGADGDLIIFPSGASDNHNLNAATLHFDSNGGNLWIGGNGTDGDISLFPSSATNNHDVAEATIHLDANTGEINFSNADCAEEFTVAEDIDAPPGSVMVIDDKGLLKPSENAYDKRVVGIISGAGQYKPGLILDKKDRERHRRPIAIMGKVYCMAIADATPINFGDLLTTSHLSGHAMKVEDLQQAFGAVIGKALAPLEAGTGLIPVLVTLQ